MRTTINAINTAKVFPCLACTILALPPVSIAATGMDVCSRPDGEPGMSIGYFRQKESSFDPGPGATNRENYSADFRFGTGNPWSGGLVYRGANLGVEELPLQTNGHLHAAFIPVHWSRHSGSDGFRISVAPGISASSNVTNDLGEYFSDALQLLGAIVWSRQLSDRLGLDYGICGDHRFGKDRIYPVVSLHWAVRPGWSIEAGFPRLQLHHQLSDDVSWALRLSPNGNEWYVKDDTREKNSRLYHEAYLAEWAVDWRFLEYFGITLSVGLEFESEYEMTLIDDSRVRLSNDDAARFGVSVTWFF